jgi:ribosomal protein L30
VRALGLRKINQVVERPDTPAFRGMVKKSRICWRSLISVE